MLCSNCYVHSSSELYFAKDNITILSINSFFFLSRNLLFNIKDTIKSEFYSILRLRVIVLSGLTNDACPMAISMAVRYSSGELSHFSHFNIHN